MWARTIYTASSTICNREAKETDVSITWWRRVSQEGSWCCWRLKPTRLTKDGSMCWDPMSTVHAVIQHASTALAGHNCQLHQAIWDMLLSISKHRRATDHTKTWAIQLHNDSQLNQQYGSDTMSGRLFVQKDILTELMLVGGGRWDDRPEGWSQSAIPSSSSSGMA